MLLKILWRSSNFTGPEEEVTSLLPSAPKFGSNKIPALEDISISHQNILQMPRIYKREKNLNKYEIYCMQQITYNIIGPFGTTGQLNLK